jgi:hypothetical protein
MKTSTLLAAMVVALAIVPVPADAQQLRLELQNGLVTLDAQNVSVRQILAEWAKVGGAKIVNGEKVGGEPITLQLTAVPERQAIDTILRGVSGYMLASRQTPDTGVSGFDRILIMPTSSAPRAAASPGTPPFATRPAPPPVQQAVEADEPEPVVEDDDHDQEEAVDPEGGAEEDVPPQVQPGMNPRFQRPTYPNPMGGVQVQPFTPQGFPAPPQAVQGDEETPPGSQPSTTPFNVPPGASATPGVIAPVPQQDQPPQRPRRPPL